jgi:hypothetical protein
MDGTDDLQRRGEIDALFERLKESAAVAGAMFVPGLPHRQAVWRWEGEDGEETDFIGIASRAGAHLSYVAVDTFDLEDVVRSRLLDARLVLDDGEEESPLLRDVVDQFATWTRHNGLSSGMTLVFLVDGLAHQFRRTTEWFDQFEDALAQRIEFIERTWTTKDEIEAQSRSAARRQQAEELARSERYARARNDMQRRYVASDLFPELTSAETDRLLELAGLIYWDEVEPEREQDLARNAADLLGRGLPVSQIAARLGVSTDRANRLLALADAHQDAD